MSEQEELIKIGIEKKIQDAVDEGFKAKWKTLLGIGSVIFVAGGGVVGAWFKWQITKPLDQAQQRISNLTATVEQLTTLSNQIVTLQSNAFSAFDRARQASDGAISVESSTMSTISNLAEAEGKNTKFVLENFEEKTANAESEFVQMKKKILDLQQSADDIRSNTFETKGRLEGLKTQATTISNSISAAEGFRTEIIAQMTSRVISMQDSSVEVLELSDPTDMKNLYCFLFEADDVNDVRVTVSKPNLSEPLLWQQRVPFPSVPTSGFQYPRAANQFSISDTPFVIEPIVKRRIAKHTRIIFRVHPSKEALANLIR